MSGTPATTPEQDRARLVRYIAADPVLIQWLRDHVASHLEAAAAELARATLPTPTAARELLERRALAHRLGDTPLW